MTSLKDILARLLNAVRAAVPSGARVDEWEGAFRWALEKPDSVEVRAYADDALTAAFQ